MLTQATRGDDMSGYLLVRVLEGVEENAGNLKAVARDVGASHQWIYRLKQRGIPNPGVVVIERLARMFYGGIYLRSDVEEVARRYLSAPKTEALLAELDSVADGEERSAA